MANLDLLTPFMKEKALELRSKAKSLYNLDIVFTSTARSYDEQRALFLQSRASLLVVNYFRRKADLPPITEEENKRPVTWTLKSEHLTTVDQPLSRAFDFAILYPGSKQISWSTKADVNKDNHSDYQQVGELAEKIGLVWGGRFSSPDMPHCQAPKKS